MSGDDLVKKTRPGLGLVSKTKNSLGKLRSAALASSTYREALALVIDKSSSMAHSCLGAESRMTAVKSAVSALLEVASPGTSKICVLTFSTQHQIVCPLTNHFSIVRDSVGSILPSGGTEICTSLKGAADQLMTQNVAVRRMIVLSDGEAYDSQAALDWAREAKELCRLPIIDTIYFNDSEGGKDLMVALAEISGGRFYYAAEASHLVSTFKQLDVKTRGLLTDGGR